MLFLWIFQQVFTRYTNKSKMLFHYKFTNPVFKVLGLNTQQKAAMEITLFTRNDVNLVPR